MWQAFLMTDLVRGEKDGVHLVLLAACKQNQLTFEDSTGRCAGAFTRNLIGQITQLKYQSGLPHIRLQELIASNR